MTAVIQSGRGMADTRLLPCCVSLQILPFLEAAVEARAEIAPALTGNRDLLYLDVALENSIRGAAERGVGSAGGCYSLPFCALQQLAVVLTSPQDSLPKLLHLTRV
jgi:hypothetical protein